MSRFIRTQAGVVNVDYIVSARPYSHPGMKPVTAISFLEGETLRTTETESVIDIVACTAPVIPALPGFSVIQMVDDPPLCVPVLTPIIGWRIESNYAQPICPGRDVTRDVNSWGIVWPTGHVESIDKVYASAADFQREYTAEKRRACMTAKATSPYEAYVANGWTDAQLIEAGFMVGQS